MTALEIILTIILWIIVGFWICFKLNKNNKTYEENVFQSGLWIPIVIFSPISLIICIIQYFIYNDWKDEEKS